MGSIASASRAWPAVLGVSSVLLVAVVATAQPGPGGPGHGGPGGPPGAGPDMPPPPPPAAHMGMLLRMEEVRAELGISEEQQTQLRELARDMREQAGTRRGERGERGARRPQGPRDGARPPRPEGGPGGPEGRPEGRPGGERGQRGGREGGPQRGTEMRERLDAMRGEIEQRLGEVLTTEQMTRLEQIELQLRVRRMGPMVLSHGPLAEELGVTLEQGEQIRAKADELRGALAQQIRDVTDASREKLYEELTTEQQAQLKEMLGEPFDMPPPPPRGERMGERRGRSGPPGPRGDRGFGPPRGGPREGRGPDGPPPPPPGE
ncbi:hypothetical protein [Botrimarina hoheduenensis]|uniref:Periplasmic heavy metal sensor n=1 Tax=Botrimarina hoheduenensis TaxID=2528000 RepID=A0A5C5WDA7_9BACT|nr:hypothetical protein [Botrimarina hoheduenensis]TWT48916.1 hypothetical protein Pla111_06930 [Botrimarina hoheduenensis]